MQVRHLIWLLGATAASPLLAQQAQPESASEEITIEKREIVVTAPSPKGSVIGSVPPDIEIGEAEIGTYGAANLAELIAAVAPVSGSSRGRGGGGPIILLEGRRISGFGEIRTIPPEAIQRFQVLPEEAAIAYGYRPEQRVINIILRPGFRSVTGNTRIHVPSAGGMSNSDVEASIFRNTDLGRLTIDLEYDHESFLYESERNIPAGTPDERAYRTLLPQTDSFTANVALSRSLFDSISATFNGKAEVERSKSGLGLSGDTLALPLEGTSDSETYHLGTSLNGGRAPINWSFTANYDHGESRGVTQFGSDRSLDNRTRSISDTGSAELVLTSSFLQLPTGKVQTTLKAGGTATALDSRSTRGSVTRTSDLSRRQGNLQASLVVPITSRTENVLPALGNISLNLNAGLTQVSDFGAINSLDYGLSWEPAEIFRLSVGATNEDGAPSISQLGAPVQVTPNVRVYDFLRGETVEINRTSGGNPDLRADNRRSFSITGTLRPTGQQDVVLTLGYTRNKTRDVAANFSTATPAIEQAFPDRFVRDASGRLISIDSRPVNLARQENDELRSSIFLSFPFGKATAPAPGAGRPGGGAPIAIGGGGGGRPPMGGFGGGGGRFGPGALQPGQGRFMFSLEHRWRFADKVQIRSGQPWLDLLDGETVNGQGGQPRHRITGRLNVFKDGFGTEVIGNWKAATRVRGNGTPGSPDLFFSDLATLDMRLFVDFDRRPAMVKSAPWLKGARLGFGVDNLFDAKQSVRDAVGVIPFGYDPDYLDPQGRTLRFTFRKLF